MNRWINTVLLIKIKAIKIQGLIQLMLVTLQTHWNQDWHWSKWDSMQPASVGSGSLFPLEIQWHILFDFWNTKQMVPGPDLLHSYPLSLYNALPFPLWSGVLGLKPNSFLPAPLVTLLKAGDWKQYSSQYNSTTYEILPRPRNLVTLEYQFLASACNRTSRLAGCSV